MSGLDISKGTPLRRKRDWACAHKIPCSLSRKRRGKRINLSQLSDVARRMQDDVEWQTNSLIPEKQLETLKPLNDSTDNLEVDSATNCYGTTAVGINGRDYEYPSQMDIGCSDREGILAMIWNVRTARYDSIHPYLLARIEKTNPPIILLQESHLMSEDEIYVR
jgi:hypothetical protein